MRISINETQSPGRMNNPLPYSSTETGKNDYLEIDLTESSKIFSNFCLLIAAITVASTSG